jgi:hypothetical protein
MYAMACAGYGCVQGGGGGITWIGCVIIVHPHWRARKVGGSVIHSLIRRRLYVNYLGLKFKFTRQVVLVIVGCGVATSNDACVRGIRGYSRPVALV